jgi:hypothetical protein
MRWMRVLVPSVLPLLLSLPARPQEVVSAHAGTVHFFEGAVFLDDQPLERKAAVFPSIKEGSTLRTEKGRAEILLTPGVVLRIDELSAIRMASTSLMDAQVELLRGSALLDSMNASEKPPVVLLYEHCRIRFTKPGIYRLDSDTGVLQAYSGQAQVTTPEGKTPSIDLSKLFFFDVGATTNRIGDPNEDEFYDWARGRAEAISAENQLAAQGTADPDYGGIDPGMFAGQLPSFGAVPSYPSYPAFGGSYLLGGTFYEPFPGYLPGTFLPMNAFPVFVVERRNGTYRPVRSMPQWPHTPHTPVPMPTRIGVSPTPIRTPIFAPRPSAPASAVPRYSRPIVTAPSHVSVPAGIHAIGHR